MKKNIIFNDIKINFYIVFPLLTGNYNLIHKCLFS